jgi:CheY-like chemotaxis protein
MESEIDRGSTFWFTIEMTEASAPPAVERAAPAHSGRSARVLVAEDIYVNRLIVESALSGAGHEVVLVQNGVEALAAVAKGGFDLVLMDMEMPEMDGIAATKAIRELSSQGAAIPIVALTANAMEDQISLCRAAGMNGHVAKPIDRDQLLAVVAKWSAM